MAGLVVKGKDGEDVWVENGKGLGVRQHDDVMLSYGLSRYTWQKMTIPVGQTGVIKVTVTPGTKFHHTEGRILVVRESPVELKVLVGAVDSEFPTVVSPMLIRSGIEEQEFAPLTLFDWCGHVPHGSEPSTGEVYTEIDIHATPAQGAQAAHEGLFTSVKGGYSSIGTKAVLFKNTGVDTAIVYYQYDWHEKAND